MIRCLTILSGQCTVSLRFQMTNSLSESEFSEFKNEQNEFRLNRLLAFLNLEGLGKLGTRSLS